MDECKPLPLGRARGGGELLDCPPWRLDCTRATAGWSAAATAATQGQAA